MPRISSVTVRRFKALHDITVPLGDTTVIIGANNAGKSSILQAVHFAVSIAQSAKLVGEGVNWKKGSFELSFNPSQLIYAPVSDVLSLASGGVLTERREVRIEIVVLLDDGEQCTVGLARGRNRNISVQVEGRVLGEQFMNIEHPFSVYAPGLAGIAKEERYLSPGVVRRVVARGDANLALRNVLRMLSADERSWESFLDHMRSLFPEINIEIDFNENTDEHIEVSVELANGPRLPIEAAGTSVLQASQILAYIELFRPRLLILDEPDSHLHPNNQRALCDLVVELAADQGFQAIISTHSRHMLDAMRHRGKVIWLSKGSMVQEADQTTTALLLDLGALDSADYFADKSLRCVIATEDTDTEPLEALLLSNGFNKDDIEIASYAGCSNVDAALVLGQFLRDRAPHLEVVVHRDRDYLADEAATKFNDRLTACKIAPFLTEPCDLESYFLNAEHLAYINSNLSAKRAQEIVDQATAETVKDSIKAIVDQRTAQAFRARTEGGPPVDHGSIATDAMQDYNADPVKMRRGKRVIGRLIGLLQAELKTNPSVYVPSPFIASATLKAISATIWSDGASL